MFIIPSIALAACLSTTPLHDVAREYDAPGYTQAPQGVFLGGALYEVDTGDVYVGGEVPAQGTYLVVGESLLDVGEAVLDLVDGQIVRLSSTGSINECSVHCGPGYHACCRMVVNVATCDCWTPDQISVMICTAGGVGAVSCSISAPPLER